VATGDLCDSLSLASSPLVLLFRPDVFPISLWAIKLIARRCIAVGHSHFSQFLSVVGRSRSISHGTRIFSVSGLLK